MVYMAFDIGGSAVKYAVVDEQATILEQGNFPTPADSIDALIQGMAEVTNEFRKKYSFAGIALSAPGAVDDATGFIGGASAVPCLHGPNVRELLVAATGLSVAMENDANCAALAEVWNGVAKDEQDVLFVVCGSGIGGAVIKDRKLHKGKHLYGGEFGYMILDCDFAAGRFDTWSTVGSTNAIVRNVLEAKGLLSPAGVNTGADLVVRSDEWNGKRVFEEAERGDIDCQRAIDSYFAAMAMGIFNLQHTYDPSMIVIGGAISARDDMLERVNEKLDWIEQNFAIRIIRPNVQRCAYSNDANLIGAVFNFINR